MVGMLAVVAFSISIELSVSSSSSSFGVSYVVNRETKTLNHQNIENSLKPVKAWSITECILTCRIQFKEAFFVEEQQNCFCISKLDENKDLASTTDGQIEGDRFREHKV